jgi:hypothetical protein
MPCKQLPLHISCSCTKCSVAPLLYTYALKHVGCWTWFVGVLGEDLEKLCKLNKEIDTIEVVNVFCLIRNDHSLFLTTGIIPGIILALKIRISFLFLFVCA